MTAAQQTADQIVEDEVRELVRRRGLDPSNGDGVAVRQLIDEVVTDYAERRLVANMPPLDDAGQVAKAVADRVIGMGPLQPFFDDPDVEEIWINEPGKVFVAKAGRPQLTTTVLTEEHVHDLVELMLRASGRRVDLSSPVRGRDLERRVPASRRYPRHHPPSLGGQHRRFVLRAHSLSELVRLGALSSQCARFLEAAVVAGLNIVVAGATQSGKTTTLNCLAAAIPARERVITCEEVFELQVGLSDTVAMQTRQPNLEGEGEIRQRRLIKEALRMRPDRLIVGEVRQEECLDLLIAFNSGIPGMTSVHANSAREALVKLTTLPLLAGENVSHRFILPTVASTIDLIVFLRGDGWGRRRVEEVLAVSGRVEEDQVEASLVFRRTGDRLLWTGEFPPHAERFRNHGIELVEVLAP